MGPNNVDHFFSTLEAFSFPCNPEETNAVRRNTHNVVTVSHIDCEDKFLLREREKILFIWKTDTEPKTKRNHKTNDLKLVREMYRV
jgi:hypothetical protein